MSSSRTELLVDVTMPQMGVSVAEGTVVAWRVEVGDRIEADATICEISSDKIDTDVPAPATGVVAEILVPVDTTVDVGTVLARIAPTGATNGASAPEESHQPTTVDTHSPGSPETHAASTADTHPPTAPTPDGSASAPQRTAGPGRYSPVVQRIAAEHGIDLSQIEGTGRGGRVRKQDVLAAVADDAREEVVSEPEPPMHIESPYRPEPVPPPAAPAPVEPRAPVGTPAAIADGAGQLSRVRRQIGEHMKRSLDTTAQCTSWIEVDMSRIEAARAAAGLTALPFVARATIVALGEHPSLNAWLEDDRYTRPSDVNLGIAVSLGADGLIVPVIQKAQELSVQGLSARIKDLARRARSRELVPDDVRSGTFTITNPGQYGTIMATPIINLPQVAILDLEAVTKRPVVVTDADGNDSIAIRPMTILGLSWDHRAMDGAEAAQFLATLKRHLEAWSEL